MESLAQRQAAGRAGWRVWPSIALIASNFLLFGVTFGFQGVAWADVVTSLQLRSGEFGTAQLGGPLISVVILVQAASLTARFGTRRLALAGLLALGAALAWLSVAGGLWSLAGAIALSGIGFGLVETASNAATLDWEEATGRRVMNLMHAGFSGGAVVGSLLGGLLLAQGVRYPQIIQLAAGLAAVLFAVTLRFAYPPAAPAPEGSGSPAAAMRLLFSGPAVVALAIICMVSTLGESVANTWSVIHLADLGAPPAIGGAAFALFNGTMFAGRLANATVVGRVGERASLVLSGACMLAAGLLLVLAPGVWPAVAAFALLGLAVAGVVPTVLSASARLAPGQSGAVTGAIMSVAYVSFIICPPAIGWAAEAFSLRLALALVAVTGGLQLALTRLIPSGARPAGEPPPAA